MSASPIILNTDEPVVSFGGYNGIDPVFTADDLAGLVDEGAVRFFLMPDREAMEEMRAEREAAGDGSPPPGGPQGGFGPGGSLPQNGSAEWIVNNCEKIPQDCGSRRRMRKKVEADRQEGSGHSTTVAREDRRNGSGRKGTTDNRSDDVPIGCS